MKLDYELKLPRKCKIYEENLEDNTQFNEFKTPQIKTVFIHITIKAPQQQIELFRCLSVNPTYTIREQNVAVQAVRYGINICAS